MATDNKFVYFFGGGDSEGKAEMKELLGGKGANLAEMASLGLPVPPGFTITTEVCDLYYKNDRNTILERSRELFAQILNVRVNRPVAHHAVVRIHGIH